MAEAALGQSLQPIEVGVRRVEERTFAQQLLAFRIAADALEQPCAVLARERANDLVDRVALTGIGLEPAERGARPGEVAAGGTGQLGASFTSANALPGSATRKNVSRRRPALRLGYPAAEVAAHDPQTTESVAPWTHLIAICFVGLAAYSNTFEAPFVFDDLQNIVHNHYIRLETIDLAGLARAGVESPTQRPLANATFALNHVACGYDVSCYRLVNVLIHLANGLVVYSLAGLLLSRLRRGPPATISGLSLLAALVFVAHPIQIQSVTYIVQRMTSLATLFYLLAAWAYVRGRMRTSGSGWGWWVTAAVCGALSFSSKQIAATLPFALALLEWLFFRDASWPWLRDRLRPFAGLIVASSVFGVVYFLSIEFPGYDVREFTMGERVLTQLRVVPFYLSLLLVPLPSRFNLIHVFEPSTSLLTPITTLLGALVLLSLAAIGVWAARRERLLSFAILWLFLHLAMESSIVPLDMAYEHRLYLPMFGFALLVADTTFRAVADQRARAILAGSLLVALLGTSTFLRNGVWRDEVTLWTDVIAKSPREERAHTNLTRALYAAGRIDEAVERLEAAAARYPEDAAVQHTLGTAYAWSGQPARAQRAYAAAARLDPERPLFGTKLALAWMHAGDHERARRLVEQVIRNQPDYHEAHFALGAILEAEGRTSEALPHYRAGLRLDPDDRVVHMHLANLLIGRGELAEATAHLREAARLSPYDPNVRDLLERAEQKLGGG